MGVIHVSREGKKVSGLYRIAGDIIGKIPGVTVVYVQTSGVCSVYGKTKFFCVSKKKRLVESDLELRFYEQEGKF